MTFGHGASDHVTWASMNFSKAVLGPSSAATSLLICILCPPRCCGMNQCPFSRLGVGQHSPCHLPLPLGVVLVAHVEKLEELYLYCIGHQCWHVRFTESC